VNVRELDGLLIRRITESNHPGVAGVEVMSTRERPDNPTRLRIDFVDGSAAYVMVAQVTGSGVERHARFELPQAVL
jgi:hypothetical protein